MRIAMMLAAVAMVLGCGGQDDRTPPCLNSTERDSWLLGCVRTTDGSAAGWAFCECAWDYRAARADCYKGEAVPASQNCAACYACVPAGMSCSC